MTLDSASASPGDAPITPPEGDAGVRPIEAGDVETADGGIDGGAVLPLSGCGPALGYEVKSPWPVQGGCERRNWRTWARPGANAGTQVVVETGDDGQSAW
jgi:hypothetical protein